jgi:rhodanese-related sulfurtransferase
VAPASRLTELHFMPPRPFLCLLAATLIGCEPPARPPVQTEPPKADLPASVRQLTPDEAERLIHEIPGLVILDVRSDGEAETEGRINGARMYDYLHGQDTVQRLADLNRQDSYLIYCAIGGRAKLTAARMHEMGFAHLHVLQGGLNAWIAAGKPVQK